MTDLRGIRRYDIEFTAQASYSEYRDMVEEELGDWVKYDDVTEALSSSEALVKELQAKVDAHSSQMSGIAQRAAEKIVAQGANGGWISENGSVTGILVKQIAAIISQEGR